MFECNYCKLVSPSEDLAISHLAKRHKDELKNLKTWKSCQWCFLYYPKVKNHQCLKDNQCPLCSEDLKSAAKQTLYNHYRTKHQDSIKVSPKIIYYLVHLIRATNTNLEFSVNFCNDFLFTYFVGKYWQNKSFKLYQNT